MDRSPGHGGLTNPAAWTDQAGYDARFEWGLAGALALAPLVDVLVVVDILRFTTSVDVAVSRGAEIIPSRFRGPEAEDLAAQFGAQLAGWAAPGDTSTFSLSPVSLQRIQPGTRLVLPSPNGSTITFEAAAASATVVAGSLRNAAAVGCWCTGRGPIAVIAAGEQWPGGALRPAFEDLVGAGAILAALAEAGRGLSPEAAAAAGAFRAARLPDDLLACSSGVELVAKGFAADLPLAADLNVSPCVPLLQDGMFAAAS
ncbi:MAG TPA: 2-phosphosulfolactate phosphatase [Chloroflexota bacterium]|nr:2-phosphosulfolactate phosphatase [Chloroflexota bacterium]